MILFLAGVAVGWISAAVVSGHMDKWLDIKAMKTHKELLEIMGQKKRSADGGASTDQGNVRKEFFL